MLKLKNKRFNLTLICLVIVFPISSFCCRLETTNQPPNFIKEQARNYSYSINQQQQVVFDVQEQNQNKTFHHIIPKASIIRKVSSSIAWMPINRPVFFCSF